MKPDEASDVLGLLLAGFHREALEKATAELWIEVIEPLDAEIATTVALAWVKNQDRFPSISQFRHACHMERRQREPQVQVETVPVGPLGLPTVGRPGWVDRWERARATANQIEDPKVRPEAGDWRVFPEQIAEGVKYHDDPRYSLAEAEEIGLMPEDAWAG